MYNNFLPGDTVLFTGQSEEQRRWGSHDDASHLTVGQTYVVKHLEVRSQHTKVTLEEQSGRFNSVCFQLVNTTTPNGEL